MDGLSKIEKACLEGKVEEAKELLASANIAGTANYHYQAGLIEETQGRYEEAIEAYEQALQLDATHRRTLFRLAYVYDMRGEESLAIDYYKQCTQHPPVHIGALMNLAVLYEELGDKAQLAGQTDRAMELYDEAADYVSRILSANPNHPRARLFLRDIEKSRQMYYDEEKEKRADKRSQKLDTPISDFELSVRSRNCLQKMDVRTLGDLIKHSETDLLSYKNFGETSLAEIKQMLASQGLHLGMAKEQTEQKKEPAATKDSAKPSADLSLPVVDMNLGVRSQRCFDKLGITTLGDLIHHSEKELLACGNFGRISLDKIKQALAEHNVALKPAD